MQIVLLINIESAFPFIKQTALEKMGKLCGI